MQGVIAVAVSVTWASPVVAADVNKAPTSVTVAAQSWTAIFDSEVRWFSWENTQGSPTGVTPPSGEGEGRQVYVPMSLSVTGNPSPDWKLELVLRGGYVSAKQMTAGERGSVSTPTDTQASATVTYNGFNGVQPFVALLANLPTGESALYGNSRFARMDSDLVDIGTYGEGFNIGPTVGVNIPITPELMFTLSGGYTARGEYDKEAADPITGLITATDRVKNGNEATVSTSLGYSNGQLFAAISASYSWSGVSKVNDVGMPGFNEYKSGPRWMVSGNLSYAWTDHWTTSLNAFWVHSGKNEALDPTRTYLIPELFNSNSDVFRIGGDATYRMDNGLSLGPVASYMHRNNNSYDPASFSFSPAKTRWSAGGQASYRVTDAVNIRARIERVWIRESEFPGPMIPGPFIPALSGQAWQMSIGGTVVF